MPSNGLSAPGAPRADATPHAGRYVTRSDRLGGPAHAYRGEEQRRGDGEPDPQAQVADEAHDIDLWRAADRGMRSIRALPHERFAEAAPHAMRQQAPYV